MAQYIDKSAVVAEIEKETKTLRQEIPSSENKEHQKGKLFGLQRALYLIDTLEVKEVGIFIPNIDDTLKEEGIDPDSKEAKVFKESYYMALEKLKTQKGE